MSRVITIDHPLVQHKLSLLRDKDSLQAFEMPAQYMFKGVPDIGEHEDYIAWTVEQMDRFNIKQAMIGLDPVVKM